MRIGKIGGLALAVLCCLAMAGCRSRTTGTGPAGQDARQEGAYTSRPSDDLSSEGESAPEGLITEENTAEKPEPGEATENQTRENPDASRKEYDENAPAEILPGAEKSVHGPGEGSGASTLKEDAETTANLLEEDAEETATQTVAADQAEQMGVSEDAEEADSALTYYTVLLQERTGSLFECQRRTVYWETAKDHVTVYRTAPEHNLILNAGAYDVSARLLEENLRVDDGWIGRKNPEVIVKVVDSSILGGGVFSDVAAKKMSESLLARDGWAALDAVRNRRVALLAEELLEAPYLQTVAMLVIAKTAYPDLMADVEMDKAMQMLTEEATGSIPSGIFWYIP